jgi:hypothetical protein
MIASVRNAPLLKRFVERFDEGDDYPDQRRVIPLPQVSG